MCLYYTHVLNSRGGGKHFLGKQKKNNWYQIFAVYIFVQCIVFPLLSKRKKKTEEIL